MCAAYLTLSVICMFWYVGHSFQSPTNSRFFNETHCFHSMRAKVCTCSSTQTDKHCMMMDRTFFSFFFYFFFSFRLNRPILCCEQCLENSSGNIWKTSRDSHARHFLWFKVCVHFVHFFHITALLNNPPLIFFFFFFHFGVTLEFHAGMCMWKKLYLPACDASNLLFLCFSQCEKPPMLRALKHFSQLFAKTQWPWSLKRTPLLIWQTTEPFSALPCSFLNKITHSLPFNFFFFFF